MGLVPVPDPASRHDIESVADVELLVRRFYQAVAFLCSDRSRFVTGEVVNVSGGWYVRG